MLLGNKIRSLRDEQGILQRQVAAYLEIDSRPLKSLIRRDVPNPKRLGKLFNHVQKEPHGPFEVVCCCR